MHDTVINNNNNSVNNNSEDGIGGSGGDDPTTTAAVDIKDDNMKIFVKESLRDRIFYAAKDGFSLTLLIILKDLDPFVVNKVLNQVRSEFFLLYLLV